MHPFGSVCLILVFNNRNHHKSQVKGVRICSIGVCSIQVLFTVNVGEKNGTCTVVCLIEGVRLIWGPLNTGLTVYSIKCPIVYK